MFSDESLPEGSEIRITSSGKERNYIGYAVKLMEEKELDTVVLTGMGSAITKTITVAEILKRRIVDLHQWTEIESREVQVIGLFLVFDLNRLLSKGLVPQKDHDNDGPKIETMRKVSCIRITLSKNAALKAQTDAAGYQPPLPAHMVTDAPPPAARKSATPAAARTGPPGAAAASRTDAAADSGAPDRAVQPAGRAADGPPRSGKAKAGKGR
jgi:DNA-binding protein